MDVLIPSIVGGAIAFAVTYWLGKRVGVVYRKLKQWQVRLAYVPGVLLGTAICYLGAVGAQAWLWVTGLCVMGGSLVGLRHGRRQADDERKAALKAEREAAGHGQAGEVSG